MVPNGISGTVKSVVEKSDHTVTDVIAVVEDDAGTSHELTLMQKWPVRIARPYARKYVPSRPMNSGQRIVDTMFPSLKPWLGLTVPLNTGGTEYAAMLLGTIPVRIPLKDIPSGVSGQILVKAFGDGVTTLDSDTKTIKISQYATPDSKNLVVKDCSISTQNNGTVTIYYETPCEYRKEGFTTYTDVKDRFITNLTPGKYYIRSRTSRYNPDPA